MNRAACLTLALTGKPADDARWALDGMENALSDSLGDASTDFDYSPMDLPWVDDAGNLHFPFGPSDAHRSVLDELLYRLEEQLPRVDGTKSPLARTLRRVFHIPDDEMREMTRLRGAHETLIRQGVFKGINLNALACRLWGLEAMRAERPLPEIRWRACAHHGTGGVAHIRRWRVTMSVGVESDIENTVEVLLHELVHMTCPPKEHHGELFCRRLIACAREAFGLQLDTATLLALPRAGKKNRAYAIDDVIQKALRATPLAEHLRSDPLTRFDPPPPENQDDVAVRQEATRNARAAEREAHARSMLAAWERKLAAAKKRAAKWRQKVRYYERRQQAAKERKSKS